MESKVGSAPAHRSFWQRPEGRTGLVILGLIGAGALVGLYRVLPFLIEIAANTLYLALLVGALAFLYCMVFVWDRPRTLLFYALQMVSRWITSNFVELDPVAILKSFVRQMKKRREVIATRLQAITGAKRMVEGKIKQKEKERQEALRLANAAQGLADQDGLNAHAEIAARRAKDVQEYQQMVGNLESIESLMTRVLRRADYHIQTAEDEANQLADKHYITSQVKAATDAAQGIFADSDLADVRDMAAERIRDDYEKRLGELQMLIDMTDFDHAVDLSQMAFRSEGLKQLEEANRRVSEAERADPSSSPRMITGGDPLAALPGASAGAGGAGAVAEANRWAGKIRRPAE
jgi:hypothetical protein